MAAAGEQDGLVAARAQDIGDHAHRMPDAVRVERCVDDAGHAAKGRRSALRERPVLEARPTRLAQP